MGSNINIGRLYWHNALQQATYLGTVHKILFNLVVLSAMLIRRHSKECSIHLNMAYDYHWMICALRPYSPKIWTRLGISLCHNPFLCVQSKRVHTLKHSKNAPCTKSSLFCRMNYLLEHVTLPIRPSELAAIIPELLLPYSHQCRPAKSLKSRPSYRRVIYRCPIFIGLGLAISETKIVTRIFSRSPKLDHPRKKPSRRRILGTEIWIF